MNTNRRDRVRPSSIQLLPADADEAVSQALHDVIVRGSATQGTALATLNDALAELGLGAVTMSSFNRLITQFRVEGIPIRYRVAGAEQDAGANALVELIDQRINAALMRRGVAAR